jgi:hypothetical protein
MRITLHGVTVQGSILGTILYAKFVAPLFDLKFFVAFSEDTLIPRLNYAKPN